MNLKKNIFFKLKIFNKKNYLYLIYKKVFSSKCNIFLL
jgi:hypothetical protein